MGQIKNIKLHIVTDIKEQFPVKTMTTLESVCEEKLSPNKSPQATRTHEVLEKEKSITKDDATYNDGGRTADGVLDEIAAKVHNMGMTDGDEDDDVGGTNHEKCMETVRSQGETINTLINQLRVMFEEYTSMNNESEYYEELNEALFRCLELNDGTVAVESDTDDDDGGEEGTAGATIGEKNDSEVVMTKQEATTAKKTRIWIAKVSGVMIEKWTRQDARS